ncbi:8534_t:CDS:2, partial [Racocetra fulgida]
VIEKLVEAVNKMTLQLQEKKRPPREYSKEFLAKIVCFKCGKPGHISWVCQENIKPTNIVKDPDKNVTVSKETLQALLSLLDDKKEEGAHDQLTFLSFQKNRPIKTRELYENDEDEIMTAGTLTDEDEFDNEDLEDRIYGVSNSEDEYWFEDVWSSLSSSSTDLISFDSADETDENHEETDEGRDEILVSSLPPLYQDLDELNLTMTLSTTYLLGEGDEPIVDLLDFYYKEKIPEIAYRNAEFQTVEVVLGRQFHKTPTYDYDHDTVFDKLELALFFFSAIIRDSVKEPSTISIRCIICCCGSFSVAGLLEE